jgi:hypothetical protein
MVYTELSSANEIRLRKKPQGEGAPAAKGYIS